jgi:hypothetical protein
MRSTNNLAAPCLGAVTDIYLAALIRRPPRSSWGEICVGNRIRAFLVHILSVDPWHPNILAHLMPLPMCAAGYEIASVQAISSCAPEEGCIIMRKFTGSERRQRAQV